jgi:hypothetical protein
MFIRLTQIACCLAGASRVAQSLLLLVACLWLLKVSPFPSILDCKEGADRFAVSVGYPAITTSSLASLAQLRKSA